MSLTPFLHAPILPVYRAGLIAWALLVVLQLVWHAWLVPPQHMPMALLLAITVVPLLLPLFALRDVRRALLWVGILSCSTSAMAWLKHGVRRASAGWRWRRSC